ncbi:rRNA N6-adenosine-methyltransferase ZCCHC4 [Hylaeus volcanicus]|uniref:rRNA N6-adenosine-methyltransferase ZCCHC4 n=1 Tax=Hylaeus volcanicus TaxID=313075 RepID=UPI0023B87540|nr:rRNA N6-adenosine-methyltransferase ZCCHC4 [Hylaeus volcanicus]
MECFWSDPSKHPQCPHGPTLLFGEYVNGKLNKFYTCAACRERKLCKFHLKEGETLTKKQAAKWEQKKKEFSSRYHHRPLYVHFNKIMSLPPEKRCYCQTCDKLMHHDDKDKHQNHDLHEGVTDYHMKHPTEMLKPLENSRQEAQYFFSKKSTEEMTDMLAKLGAKQVLCIGTPKIHEHILDQYEDKISSLLLDLDGRFHNFFGPLSYCWYNLLNNHFFDENALHVFKDFLTQNGGKDTFLICDPPFGSRVEPMSWTIKRIADLHKKWNNIEDENDCLKIMFIFPYFMESIMKQKSNPPGVSGGLKDLKMVDYKVSYDNHALFVTEPKANKLPSPIRIFTNVPLHLVELPKASGYKYCKKCQKWVSEENKHCKKCKDCTSKNGLTYKHCNACNRCVKPNWEHCKTCLKCAMKNHKCGQKPKVNGRCFKCNELGHVQRDCNVDQENNANVTETKEVKKRKASKDTELVSNKKKRKVDNSVEDAATPESKNVKATLTVKNQKKVKVRAVKNGVSSKKKKVKEQKT